MAFLTLCTANFLYCYHAIHGVILNSGVELLVYAVKTIVFKLHLSCAVAVYAPAHAQWRKLVHFVHFGNFSMAGLALNFACYNVL